eukprot:5532851-Pleurochrysis_carterae.AAC.1
MNCALLPRKRRDELTASALALFRMRHCECGRKRARGHLYCLAQKPHGRKTLALPILPRLDGHQRRNR